MNSLGKQTLISCAVAAALGSSSAFAVTFSSAPTPDYIQYAGGGSAQANAFFVATCKLLSNVDVYSDAGATLSGDYYVMYGVSTSTIGGGIPSGKNVLYIYKFNGGSQPNGIVPQSGSGANLLYPTLGSITGSLTTQASAGTACNAGVGVPTFGYTGSANTQSALPDFGLTDVEPAMFRGYNNPAGNGGGSAANTNGGAAVAVGTSDGIYDNLFGVAVTANVYTASHPKTSFSRAEMEGILQGNISDWSQLYADDGTALAAGGIIFLDRGEGSGTKASGSEYFLGYPGDAPGAVFPFSATSGYCGTTIAGCGGGQHSYDVAESSTNNLIADLKNAQAGGLRAIGILGLENPPAKNQVGGANVYDFCKVNGVAVDTGASGDNINGTSATSYSNVVKGDYDFYFQNSFNTRSGVTGNAAAFSAAYKAQMTLASFVGANASLGFPQAVSGTLLDADKVSSLAAGVTLNSRAKISTGPLAPVFDARSGSIPVSSDPL